MSARRQEANQARDKIIDRLRAEGVAAAYERSIKLLRDDGVPATAHATLARVVFQAAGVLKAAETDVPEKDLHELTAEEIQNKLAAVQAAIQAEIREFETAGERSEEDMFG